MLKCILNQFSVQSEIHLPGIAQNSDLQRQALRQISIKSACIQEIPCLARQLQLQPSYDIGHGIIMERGSNSFYVSFQGDQILVDNQEQDYTTRLVAGPGICACTFFTKGLPLFASCVLIGNHLVGFLGSSGTGKSTILWSLLQSGCLFASDDLLPILFDNGLHLAYPSVSLFPKLRPPTLEHFGMNSQNLHRVTFGEDKFWVPLLPEQITTFPKSLSALFLLQPLSTAISITVRRNSLEKAAQIVNQYVHSRWLAEKYLKPKVLAAQCESLISAVPVYTITYSKSFEALPRITEAIDAAIHHPVQTEAIY